MNDTLYPVQLYLTTAQLRKFQTQKAFQLRPEQISAGHEQSQAKHHVEIMLKKTHYRKVCKVGSLFIDINRKKT